jgi:hypothetical protein
MSLLRLLTAGKSLVGLKKSETRYHLPSERALPKFGSKKNPFRATALPEQGQPAPEKANEPRVDPSVSVHEEKAQDRPEVVSEPPNNPAAVTEIPAAVTEAASHNNQGDGGRLERPERRTSAVRAFLLWGRAKARRTGIPNGRPLVQGELSLDKVKVVRNDLSESDVEIVGRASQPKTPEGQENATVGKATPSANQNRMGSEGKGRLRSLGTSFNFSVEGTETSPSLRAVS